MRRIIFGLLACLLAWPALAQMPGSSGNNNPITNCIYNATAPSLISGQRSPCQVDSSGNLFTNSSVTKWGGGTLGAMANYGTSPGAVLVPGVNAFMTSGNVTQIGGSNLAL